MKRSAWGYCETCTAHANEPCMNTRSHVAMRTIHKGRPKLPPPPRGAQRAEDLMAKLKASLGLAESRKVDPQ